MAKYTMTIEQILKSLYPENLAFRTKEEFKNGDYLSPHEIIKETKNLFFSKMKLNKYVNEDFKIQFLFRFYNEEIGFETVTPFFTRLETILNNDCLMQLKLADDLRNQEIEKLINQNNLTSSSSSNSVGSGVGLVETTPETSKSIVFNMKDENFSFIEYADSIQENHNKSNATGNTVVTGFSGGNMYYLLLQSMLQFTDPYTQIFNICEGRLFMNLY